MNCRPDIGRGMNAGSHVSGYNDVRRDPVAFTDGMTTVQLSLVSLNVKIRHVELRPIHTIRHVSDPSPFHLRPARLVCVHTVRRVQSHSSTARDRKPALVCIKYAASFVF
jgi:hypothetical protein